MTIQRPARLEQVVEVAADLGRRRRPPGSARRSSGPGSTGSARRQQRALQRRRHVRARRVQRARSRPRSPRGAPSSSASSRSAAPSSRPLAASWRAASCRSRGRRPPSGRSASSACRSAASARRGAGSARSGHVLGGRRGQTTERPVRITSAGPRSSSGAGGKSRRHSCSSSTRSRSRCATATCTQVAALVEQVDARPVGQLRARRPTPPCRSSRRRPARSPATCSPLDSSRSRISWRLTAVMSSPTQTTKSERARRRRRTGTARRQQPAVATGLAVDDMLQPRRRLSPASARTTSRSERDRLPVLVEDVPARSSAAPATLVQQHITSTVTWHLAADAGLHPDRSVRCPGTAEAAQQCRLECALQGFAGRLCHGSFDDVLRARRNIRREPAICCLAAGYGIVGGLYGTQRERFLAPVDAISKVSFGICVSIYLGSSDTSWFSAGSFRLPFCWYFWWALR